MSENREHNIENHVSGQRSEGSEGGGSQEQNVEGISNENEYMALASDVHAASDLGRGHVTQTIEQSNGVTQSSSEPSTESNQVLKIERVDLDNVVLAGTLRGDHVDQKSTATVKEDTFVDCPHELSTYNVRKIDNNEEVEAREAKDKFEEIRRCNSREVLVR